MDDSKVMIEIDVNKDFDGIDLETAIEEVGECRAGDILKLIHHKWVVQIGHPEWSMIEIYE